MRGATLPVVGSLLVMGMGMVDRCEAAQTAKPDAGATKTEKDKTDKTSAKDEKDKADKPAAKSDAPTWMADISRAEIPKKPASGKLHGETFTLERAELQGGVLSLRQGQEFFADLEFKLFLFVDGPGQLENQGLEIIDEENPPTKTVPHVYVSWKPDAKSLPKTKSWTGDYVIRIKFGQIKNGRLPGEIYLCLPDLKQSFVAGTFNAILK